MSSGAQIRVRILVATTALALGVGAAVAAGAAVEGGRRAAEDLRAQIARAAEIVAAGGFFASPATLRHLSTLIGADVATLDGTGPIAASDGSGGLDAAVFAAWVRGEVPPAEAGEPSVTETTLRSGPVTVALARVPRSGGAQIALVYRGHLLTAARRGALRPAALLGGAGALLAVLAALALGRSVEGAVARLREAERLAGLGRLLSGLAHEGKTPLAAFRMTADLLAERTAEPRTREALSVIADEVEKLTLFSAKLLTYAGGAAVQARPTDLEPIVGDAVALLGRQLDHLGARVAVEGPPEAGGLAAEADPIALRHVLANLVLNAAQAMPGGGEIRVRLARAGPDRVRVEVHDEGRGVAPEDRPRLFEPFFSRRPGGTGLGLAVSRTVVEAHGGRIAYAPRSPRGSVFSVELRASQALGAAEEVAAWRAS